MAISKYEITYEHHKFKLLKLKNSQKFQLSNSKLWIFLMNFKYPNDFKFIKSFKSDYSWASSNKIQVKTKPKLRLWDPNLWVSECPKFQFQKIKTTNLKAQSTKYGLYCKVFQISQTLKSHFLLNNSRLRLQLLKITVVKFNACMRLGISEHKFS